METGIGFIIQLCSSHHRHNLTRNCIHQLFQGVLAFLHDVISKTRIVFLFNNSSKPLYLKEIHLCFTMIRPKALPYKCPQYSLYCPEPSHVDVISGLVRRKTVGSNFRQKVIWQRNRTLINICRHVCICSLHIFITM